MEEIDLLISARWVIPVAPEPLVHEHYAVAVRGRRIVDILPASEATRRYHAEEHVNLPRHALIPGLVNAHTHAAMTLMRGLADDLPLMTWLQQHIWPAEARWVGADFVRDGTRLAIAEMLRGGTTCFNDMYFFPEITARVAVNLGMRASIGMIVVDFPSAWARNADEYIARGLDEVMDAHKGEGLISTCFAPHAPYTVSDAPLERIRNLSNELERPVHIHVHETQQEIDDHLTHHGVRPLARLDALGLLGPNLVAVHMTQLSDHEIALLAERGASVVHCPQSNLKLASGFAPVAHLIEAGVNVALGTDGAASNNDLDLWDEMRTAALLAKGVAGRADALPAHAALRMATLSGARALGLDEEIGSIEVGKAADLVAVDLGRLETQPIYDPVSHLVYAAGREAVSHVWIAGQSKLVERELTQLNVDELAESAASWAMRIGSSDRAED
ncbi:N-ethylammeline chlorohydrolase [Acidihalobacter aeolianus]|uniref:5-methylthioadenosine/S-adenosylhomocysteine deaminase n=1 Tax=Acidihalobacter aeolianus TaxID=2792603 RepID=A0A1D8K8D3_9GAMM|nr:TRZ/ATZ family hydrolase [Acidihalobacter aeolianus]AOV17206.1 N-ethylammeline chlorohydrolase [Acidihalobacter aeolianus]